MSIAAPPISTPKRVLWGRLYGRKLVHAELRNLERSKPSRKRVEWEPLDLAEMKKQDRELRRFDRDLARRGRNTVNAAPRSLPRSVARDRSSHHQPRTTSVRAAAVAESTDPDPDARVRGAVDQRLRPFIDAMAELLAADLFRFPKGVSQ